VLKRTVSATEEGQEGEDEFERDPVLSKRKRTVEDEEFWDGRSLWLRDRK